MMLARKHQCFNLTVFTPEGQGTVAGLRVIARTVADGLAQSCSDIWLHSRIQGARLAAQSQQAGKACGALSIRS